MTSEQLSNLSHNVTMCILYYSFIHPRKIYTFSKQISGYAPDSPIADN